MTRMVLCVEKMMTWSVKNITPTRVPIIYDLELRDYRSDCAPLRRTSLNHCRIVEERLEKMLTVGIIRPSSSSWGFEVVTLSKGHEVSRFSSNFRPLDKRTKSRKCLLLKVRRADRISKVRQIVQNFEVGYRLLEHPGGRTGAVDEFGTLQACFLMQFRIKIGLYTFSVRHQYCYRTSFEVLFVKNVLVRSESWI